MVQVLLTAQIDVRITNKNFDNALHVAVSLNRLKIAQILLIFNQTTNNNRPINMQWNERIIHMTNKCNAQGETPFDIACRKKNENMIRLLLISNNDMNKRNSNFLNYGRNRKFCLNGNIPETVCIRFVYILNNFITYK